MRRLLMAAVFLVGAVACAPGSRDAFNPAQPSPTPTATQPARFRFAAIGDWGSGTADERAIATRMCRWRKRHPFDLVITAGDNIYPDGAPEDFEANFFDPFDCLLSSGVRFRSTLGNHDYITDRGQPELDEESFGIPRRNYVFRRAGVLFVMVDSNALDRAWLEKALEPQPGDRWTIVAFHHPVYSPGTHGSTPGFEDLPKIFQDHDVDLVVNGHDHIYSVSRPLAGIRYLVTGGGGAGLYECSEASFTDVCVERHHFVYITVTQDKIRVTAVPGTGDPFDRFATGGRS